MTFITVKLSFEEVSLLTALASDQLFRREFIDPKMPGYRVNPLEIRLGKKLVDRLRQTADRARRLSVGKRVGTTAKADRAIARSA